MDLVKVFNFDNFLEKIIIFYKLFEIEKNCVITKILYKSNNTIKW